ncbi:MAG: YebC/PmpR family DNA-binding transcriptional regulator [Ignavibacteriales bacterium]|nr:YebC/PmpR family DNA-binding transcriptional regulator [Ignavibacteriales bacterium]
MSGHSKWATIKRKKAVADSKRGKMFTKLIKEITIAAREGGGDPGGNPRLRLAIDNAKGMNMPADNIDRAIKKATGELEGVTYHELNYEGYGPGGIAMMIEVATDNKNRAVAEVRHICSKYHGSLGESGSVAWMFQRMGVIIINRGNSSEEELLETILEAGAEDMTTEEEFFEVKTNLEDFENVRRALVGKNYEIESANLQWVPKNLVKVSGDAAESIIRLIEALEDSDDVQHVFSNADFEV